MERWPWRTHRLLELGLVVWLLDFRFLELLATAQRQQQPHGNDNEEAMGEAFPAMAGLSKGALRQLHWVAWVLEPKWIQM